MTSTATRPEVDAYLAALRASLSDLPSADREDLLAEVAASVVEAASEGSIEARLGPAAVFSRELRAAAGLAASPSRKSFNLRPAWERWSARARGLGELVPIWWAVRGFVVVTALGFAVGWSISHPSIPRFVHSPSDARDGAVAIAVGVVLSIAVGVRTKRLPAAVRRTLLVVDAAVVVLVLPVALHLAKARPVYQQVVTYSTPQPGLLYDGALVQNIYPYTRDGKLLHDVLLYDELGRPLAVNRNDPDPNRRVLHTAGKYVAIYNSFPIRYFDPGTTHVSQPNAGPRVHVAQLAPGP